MDIKREKNGAEMMVAVSGRIDTNTSPELEAEVKPYLDGVEKLTIDFHQVNYISSAGLRVLLSLQKMMNQQGEMKITGVNALVEEIFEVTGFSDILTYEKGEE